MIQIFMPRQSIQLFSLKTTTYLFVSNTQVVKSACTKLIIEVSQCWVPINNKYEKLLNSFDN